MFEMLFLQFLYDLSNRVVEKQCIWNLLFKSFLGLSAEKLPPDQLCFAASGIVWGLMASSAYSTMWWSRPDHRVWCRRLHIIDVTHMTAKVDLFRLKKEHRAGNDDYYVDRNSPAPEPAPAARPP